MEIMEAMGGEEDDESMAQLQKVRGAEDGEGVGQRSCFSRTRRGGR